MALFHFTVTQTKRSKGQSAIASAAYRSGEKLYSEYYGEYSDYTRKRGVKEGLCDMVRCRAKGENYSYDFAASLQNTDEQSNLISERDLTAWKGAAERMLTNEIVLKVFSDYLNRDTDFEVVLTSKGYTVMGFDNHRQDWNTVDFCPTPEDLLDSLLDAYENFRMMEITGGDRDLTEKEEAKLAKERDALTALCEKEAAKCSS